MLKKMLVASFIGLITAIASAAASDKDAIAAAKSLAALWSEIPARNFVLLECRQNTIKLLRIQTSGIAFDVVKSDSLISPYKIIINMEVSSQTNEPTKVDLMAPNAIEKLANEVCYKNFEDAARHTSEADFAEMVAGGRRTYFSRLVYGYGDDGYRLLSVAPSATSGLFPGALQSQRNATVWGRLVSGR